MIRILIGPKGTGKTKTFINMVNEALSTEKGNVVCITKGSRHTFDISSGVRLVDTDEFHIKNIDAFYGLISGMISQDFDITHIFIDSITKLITCDLNDINSIISDLEVLSEKFNVDFTLAISSEAEELPANISKYKF